MKYLLVWFFIVISVFDGCSKEIPSVSTVELKDFDLEPLIVKEKKGRYAKNTRFYIQSHTGAKITCGVKSEIKSIRWTFENGEKIDTVVSWNSKILISKDKTTLQFTYAVFWMTGLYYCSPKGREKNFDRYEYTIKVYTLANVGVTFKFTFLTTDCYKEPVKSEALNDIKEFFCPKKPDDDKKSKRSLNDVFKKGFNASHKKISNYMASKFPKRVKRHLLKQLMKNNKNLTNYEKRSEPRVARIYKILRKREASTKKLNIKYVDMFPYDADAKQVLASSASPKIEEFGEISKQEYFSNISAENQLTLDCNYDFKIYCNGFDTEPWLSIRNGRRVSLSQMTATMFSTIPRTENCDFKCGVQMKIDQLNTMLKEVDLQVIRKFLSDKYKKLDGRYMNGLTVRNGKVIRAPKKVDYIGHFLCPPGQVILQQRACIPCDKGTFSIGHNERDLCVRCPKNTFQAYMGATKCEHCGLNMITDDIAATSNTFCINRQAKFQNKLINDSVVRYMSNYKSYYAREIILFLSSAITIFICFMMWCCLLFQDASSFSTEWISSMKYRWFIWTRNIKENGFFYNPQQNLVSP